jgi:hypothetical protein
MVAQHAIDPSLPGLSEVVDVLRTATFQAVTSSPYEEEIRRATARALVERLMWLAAGAPMPEVRAEASAALRKIQIGEHALNGKGDGPAQALLAADIRRFLERPMEPLRAPTPYDAPPGAPIGDAGTDWLATVPWCSWDGRVNR